MLTPNKTEQRAIDSLRSRGFAVVVFNPTELDRADPSLIEDIMVERGWAAIDDVTAIREDA